MTMLKNRTKRTYADYQRLPEDVRCELIRGEFYVSPSPTDRHQRAVVNLVRILDTFARAQRLGQIYVSPFDCILSDEDVVQPDVLFVSNSNLPNIRDRLFGAPDLAIEVLSKYHAERDRIVKRDLYAERGVREYWIVDPEERTIEVLVADSGRWRNPGLFGPDDALTSPALPKLELPVAEVFA